jgi:hypothetical protein
MALSRVRRDILTAIAHDCGSQNCVVKKRRKSKKSARTRLIVRAVFLIEF